jgi:hypothetical protein
VAPRIPEGHKPTNEDGRLEWRHRVLDKGIYGRLVGVRLGLLTGMIEYHNAGLTTSKRYLGSRRNEEN